MEQYVVKTNTTL